MNRFVRRFNSLVFPNRQLILDKMLHFGIRLIHSIPRFHTIEKDHRRNEINKLLKKEINPQIDLLEY